MMSWVIEYVDKIKTCKYWNSYPLPGEKKRKRNSESNDLCGVRCFKTVYKKSIATNKNKIES